MWQFKYIYYQSAFFFLKRYQMEITFSSTSPKYNLRISFHWSELDNMIILTWLVVLTTHSSYLISVSCMFKSDQNSHTTTTTYYIPIRHLMHTVHNILKLFLRPIFRRRKRGRKTFFFFCLTALWKLSPNQTHPLLQFTVVQISQSVTVWHIFLKQEIRTHDSQQYSN